MFAETLENPQRSTRPSPESRRDTFKFSSSKSAPYAHIAHQKRLTEVSRQSKNIPNTENKTLYPLISQELGQRLSRTFKDRVCDNALPGQAYRTPQLGGDR
jgi:hypothetical protein